MPKPPVTTTGPRWDVTNRWPTLSLATQTWWAPGTGLTNYRRYDGPAVVVTGLTVTGEIGTRMRWFVNMAPVMEVLQGNNRLPIKRTWSGNAKTTDY